MASRLGSPNKRRFDVEQRLKELNCDPLEGMARIAKIAEAQGDLSLAGQMHKELIKYILPQLKAVEHSGNIDGSFDITRIERVIIDPKNESL